MYAARNPRHQPGRYAVVDDSQIGPLTTAELRQLISAGTIGRNTLMWRPGLTAWKEASGIPDVNRWFYLKG